MDTPIDQRDKGDPGDSVQRSFRYQHAYGVVLIVGALLDKLDYTALWCEQHEDFLAQVSDSLFDAYQVKTKRSELGAWRLNDEEFHKSITRFVGLDDKFPERIRRFKFVSNTEPLDSSAKAIEYLCPVRLAKAVALGSSFKGLNGHVKRGFDALREKADAEPDALFAVLKRFDFILGPTKRAFEAELSQDHIGKLKQCSALSPSILARVRETLIAQVGRASSLYSDDSSRHYSAVGGEYRSDPLLIAKRISLEDAALTINESAIGGFQYLPSLATLELGSGSKLVRRLAEKMGQGGLAHHYEVMRRRSLSAEQVLLDLATRSEGGAQMLSQLENVVFAECDDARLRVLQTEEPYGVKMLIDVQERLRLVAQNDPRRVYSQRSDVLVGIAGLLTSECRVWWSAPFQFGAIQ